MTLYHATYKNRLESIKKHGLGAKQMKNWGESKEGLNYFTTDLDCAVSYCECAENVDDKTRESGIVVLTVESNKLEKSKIGGDSNQVYDSDTDVENYTYKGTVSPELVHVICSDNKLVILKKASIADVKVFG